MKLRIDPLLTGLIHIVVSLGVNRAISDTSSLTIPLTTLPIEQLVNIAEQQ